MQDKMAIQKSGSFLTQGELPPLVGKLKRRSIETLFCFIVKTAMSDHNYNLFCTELEFQRSNTSSLSPNNFCVQRSMSAHAAMIELSALWPKANAILPGPINYRSARSETARHKPNYFGDGFDSRKSKSSESRKRKREVRSRNNEGWLAIGSSFNGTESGAESYQRGSLETAKPIEITGIKW
jgi:hypothetical protein